MCVGLCTVELNASGGDYRPSTVFIENTTQRTIQPTHCDENMAEIKMEMKTTLS